MYKMVLNFLPILSIILTLEFTIKDKWGKHWKKSCSFYPLHCTTNPNQEMYVDKLLKLTKIPANLLTLTKYLDKILK